MMINLYYDKIIDGVPVPNGVSNVKFTKDIRRIPVKDEDNNIVLNSTYFYNTMLAVGLSPQLYTKKQTSKNLFYPVEFADSKEKHLHKIIPKSSIERIKDGKMKLLVLFYHKGANVKTMTRLNEKLEAFMFKKGIPQEQIVVVTGDIACAYKQIFWRFKIYGIDWGQISTQITLKSRYHKEQDLEWVFQNEESQPLTDAELRSENFVIDLWNRPERLFSAYTGNISNHSAALISELIVRDLLKHGKASYNIYNSSEKINIDLSDFYREKKNTSYIKAKNEALEYLNSKKLILDYDGSTLHNNKFKFDKNELQNTAFSLICDSYAPLSKPKFVSEINTLHVGKAVWRHIAIGHPFMLLGSLNTMNYLNQEGYFSCNLLFNEIYDRTTALSDRVDLICEQIEKLSLLSMHQLNEVIQETKQYLKANQRRFYGKDNSIKFKKLFEEMKYEHF